MKIKNTALRIPIILNLILICSLYGDFMLPSMAGKFETFESFNSITTHGASWRGSSGKSISNILNLENGNFYRIARIPDGGDNIRKGEKVYVEKTLILNKLKHLEYDNLNYQVSILAFPEIIIGFSFCLIITLANVITDKLPDFLLGLGSMFVYFMSVSYLFYFS